MPLDFLAALCGENVRTMQTMVQHGHLPKPVRFGRYDGPLVIEAHRTFRDSGNESDKEIAQSKRRHWKAKADLIELELAQAAGEVVPIAAAKARLEDVLARTARRLDAVPSRVAAQVAGMTNVAEIRRVVLEEIRAARRIAVDDVLAGRPARRVRAVDAPAESDA